MTLGLILLLGGAAVGANVWLDIYGIFRNPSGRHLSVFGDDRIAKYLLSERYVPANFNSVLIGSSVSANWRIDRAGSLRVYNDSLNGGNSVEEHCLVGQVLVRPGIRVAMVVIHPYLTHSHEFETVLLSPHERIGALGSLSLWQAYKSKLKTAVGTERQVHDDSGSEMFEAARHELNPTLQRMLAGGGDFEVDPVALVAFQDSVANFRAHGVQLVFVVPPVEQDLWSRKRTAFQNYFQKIRPLIAPQDKLIDFTADDFAEFRASSANFVDGLHLTPKGARQVVGAIQAQLAGWIERGDLKI